MTQSTFFRLLKTPIDDKGDALAAQIAALNERGEAEETYTLAPTDFALIPGSPFAYWVSDSTRHLFTRLPKVSEQADVKQGLATADDFRFVRAWWEVLPKTIAYTSENTLQGKPWVYFAKGGIYSPFCADVHLVADWENKGQRIKERINPATKKPFSNVWQLKGTEQTFFFRPGLTWPRRTTSGISIRALPAGCIFADKGPAAFVPKDDPEELLALLAVMNSATFETLLKLQLGAATAAARSYEVGVIQRTPVPPFTDHESRITLAALAREAHDLQRDRDRADETTHAFCLPAFVLSLSKDGQRRESDTLLEASLSLEAEAQATQDRLAAIQAEIDDMVFDLCGLVGLIAPSSAPKWAK